MHSIYHDAFSSSQSSNAEEFKVVEGFTPTSSSSAGYVKWNEESSLTEAWNTPYGTSWTYMTVAYESDALYFRSGLSTKSESVSAPTYLYP